MSCACAIGVDVPLQSCPHWGSTVKAACLSLLAFFALLPRTSEAAPVNLSKTTQVEPITSISTEELWSTAQPKVVISREVVVRQFDIDPESTSIRGRWQACALIFVGTGDLGARPVAVRLWSTKPCDGSVSALRTSAVPSQDKFSLRVDDSQTFTILVTDNKKVSISGVELGSIEY